MTRPYQKHGLVTLKKRLQVRGLSSLDRRSATFRQAMAWRRDVESDLAGDLTAAKRTVLDLATMRMLILDHGYRWLVEQIEAKGARAVVNVTRRQLYPIVRELVQISDSQDKAMTTLGLERPAAPAQDLTAYVAKHYGGKKPRARRPRHVNGSRASSSTRDDTKTRAGNQTTSSADPGASAAQAADQVVDTSAPAIASAGPAGVAAHGGVMRGG